jgi:AcrR family transcriptional regulator
MPDAKPSATPPARADESPRERRRRAAKRRILDAARSILLEGTSVDALSLREVARRADFTPGALYRYFDDRTDIIAALFREAGRRLGDALPEAPTTPDAAWLRTVGLAYLKFAEEHPEDLMLLFQHQARVATWQEYVTLAWPFSLLVEALREGADRGLLVLPSELGAAGTAYAFWSVLHGMTELRRTHLGNVRGDFAAVDRAALAFFTAALEPPSTATPGNTIGEQR